MGESNKRHKQQINYRNKRLMQLNCQRFSLLLRTISKIDPYKLTV